MTPEKERARRYRERMIAKIGQSEYRRRVNTKRIEAYRCDQVDPARMEQLERSLAALRRRSA